ncbi:MAG: acyltransferase [Polaromonas sp.]
MTKKNSFDLIRIVAAFLVLVSHSFALTGLPEPQVLPGYSLGRIGVNVFFALSGYLIFQSLDRDPNLVRFLAKRSLRIFPGLAVMLLVTTFVIGPLLSSLPAQEYFSRAETWSYLGKIKLWGDDRLPGLFEHNRYPTTVNGSLWTLKWEWLMYCILGSIAVIKRAWWGMTVLTLCMMFVALALLSDSNYHGGPLPILGKLLPHQNPFLPGSFFLVGALLAVFQINSKTWLVPSFHWAIIVGACAVLAIGGSIATQVGLWLLAPAVIIAIGESGLSSRIGLNIRNDVSYGLYIYAFPIQQSIASLWPEISWWGSLLLATPLTVGVSFLSWCYIEKPALKLKGRIKHFTVRSKLNSIAPDKV